MAKQIKLVNTLFGMEEVVVSTDTIPSVDEQWDTWKKQNPDSSIEHIDTEEVKQELLTDLTKASQMDVREYTLYQKWSEIQEKYPTTQRKTLNGNYETQLVDIDQEKIIKEVKNNFWNPENPDDFEKLDIEMILANGKGIDNEGVDKWNAIRTFTSTMKNNSNIGRNLYYIIKDKPTKKYLGVICISSDFLDLTPRDQAIGWPKEIKTQGNMINHTAIGSTIVPIQPLGYNYMGGKLLALLCLADKVQDDWHNKYGDELVGVTTTSLYGNTKAGGLSQYDGLEYWNKMGFTSGSVAFDPTRKTMNKVFKWIKENEPRKYFEWWEAKNPQGLPLKRDHKNRSLHFAYGKLKIPKNLIRCEHQRGIYFSPLYNESFEFLRKEKPFRDLTKRFDNSTESLVNIWKTKYAKGRISMLKKKNTVSKESLFYDDLIYLTWEETKAKYLPQVGR